MNYPLVIRFFFAALAVALCLGGVGCATQRVAPWERATLADYTMRPDRDPIANTLGEHLWFSREASSGGRGVSGAGCGCN